MDTVEEPAKQLDAQGYLCHLNHIDAPYPPSPDQLNARHAEALGASVPALIQ